MAGGIDLGGLLGTPVDKETQLLKEEENRSESLTDEDEPVEKEEEFSRSNIYREDLLKALEQEKQEKTVISRSLEALKMKFEKLQLQCFDMKSSVNMLEKENQSFVEASVKRELENRDLQDRIHELEDSVAIYNEGLKNMMDSADSMKRDAKRMNLASPVTLEGNLGSFWHDEKNQSHDRIKT